MAVLDDGGDPGTNGYPPTDVTPELFRAQSVCNTALPVGEVIEWFDFGQFVELYATDASGVSHPLVLTQDDAVLQESLRVREDEKGTPTRTVDLAGGVPINRAATGDGGDAFKPLIPPEEIIVEDVDELVRTGAVPKDPKVYHATLGREQIEALKDGEPVVLRARVEGSSRREWVQLRPRVTEVTVSDLNELLAHLQVTVDGKTITLMLDPAEIAALLAGRTVVVRGTVGSKTHLLRLRQREGVEEGFAAEPATDEYVIRDLAAFFSHPVVPGIDELPFKVKLTSSVVGLLRTTGTAQVSLSNEQALANKVLTLRVQLTGE